MNRHYVYYACRGDLIKIGWSRDPAERMRHLGARMVGVERGGKETEAARHRQFAHLRTHGEWFTPATDLLSHIGQLPPCSVEVTGGDLLVTLDYAAGVLRCSRYRVRRMVAAGLLETVRVRARDRIPKVALERFVRDQGAPTVETGR